MVHIWGHDFNTVFIYDGCLGWGTATGLVLVLMEVIIGAWFLRKYFLPLLFGHEVYESFDSLKQQKLVGFCAQIVVRSSCAVQLLTILFGSWGVQITLDHGLFSQFNAKAAYHKLLDDGIPTTCVAAGMNHLDVAAFRSWYFTKGHMVAVHFWELAYIPGLTLDTWLHHLFVILNAAILSQPQAGMGSADELPLLDAIGFSYILGASLNSLVKACVVMYHYTAPSYLTQARWMEASIAGAWFLLLTTYFGFPTVFTFIHWNDFHASTRVIVVIGIIFLALVEFRLIIVKRSIARSARRKAAVAALANSCETGEAVNKTGDSILSQFTSITYPTDSSIVESQYPTAAGSEPTWSSTRVPSSIESPAPQYPAHDPAFANSPRVVQSFRAGVRSLEALQGPKLSNMLPRVMRSKSAGDHVRPSTNPISDLPRSGPLSSGLLRGMVEALENQDESRKMSQC